METRTVQLNVQTNAATTQDDFKRLHQEIAKAEQEFEDLNNTLGETDAATVAAKQKVTDLRGAYTQLNQTATDLDGTFEQVYGQLQPLTTRMGEAEDRLYELALAGKQGTKEYNDLLQAVSGYRKVQMQTDMVVDASATTMNQKLLGAVGGVASGFEVAEGAAALFGVESSKLQETMVKLQSVMAISQGIQGLKEAGSSFKALGTTAMTALKGIRTGIAATGIGLLVIALGSIVAYWDDIKEAVSGVSDEQEALNKKAEKNVTIENEKLTALDSQDNILKLQGLSEKQILQLKIKQIDLVIAATEEQIKQNQITAKAQEEATIRNFEIAKKVIAAITKIALIPVTAMIAQIDLLIKGANYVSEALGGGKLIDLEPLKEANKFFDSMAEKGAKLLFDPEQVKEDGIKLQEETQKQLTDLKNKRAGYVLAVQQIDKTNSQKTIDANKEKNDLIKNANAEAARLAIEQQNELNKRLEDIAEQNFQNSLTEQEREILLVNDKYFELETLAEGNKDALAEIELAKMNELNDINLKYQNIAYENDKVAKEKKAALDKEATEKEIAAAKAAAEQKAALQQQGLDTALQGVQLIASLFEKQKGVQKAAVIAESAIGIAKMIISNKLANAGALATPQAIATSGAAAAPVIAMNNISTGIGIAANIAATAKALKTLGGGSPPPVQNPSGGGGGAGGGAMAPQFNTIGTSGINQLATLQQQPTKAYVVSGEVTSAQSLDRNRLQNATL